MRKQSRLRKRFRARPNGPMRSQPSGAQFLNPAAPSSKPLRSEPTDPSTTSLEPAHQKPVDEAWVDKRFNLLLVGRSKSENSALVQSVFGYPLAEIGEAHPTAEGLTYYQGATLGIWNVEGLVGRSSGGQSSGGGQLDGKKASGEKLGDGDLGDENQGPAGTLREHLAVIASKPRDQQVNVAWCAVPIDAGRLDTGDTEAIKELASWRIPVIIVLTGAKWEKSRFMGYTLPLEQQVFYDWLETAIQSTALGGLPARAVIAVSDKGSPDKGRDSGVEQLVDNTLEALPDDHKDAFLLSQRLSLPQKRRLARKIMASASAASLAAAAVPIPISDATVLAPIQIGMMKKIADVYNLPVQTMMSAGALAQLSAQVAGRALARSFVKLIPGVGSVINGTVAAALTASMGEAWMRMCEQAYSGKLNPSDVEAQIKSFTPTVGAVVAQIARGKLPKPLSRRIEA